MQSGSTPTSSSNSRRKHLETELAELQQRYDVLTKLIRANDLDLGRTFDSEKRLALEDRREELSTQRISVVTQMEQIEAQLEHIVESKAPAIQAKEAESEVKQPASPFPPAPADSITIDKLIRLDFVRIPAGYFLMGTRPESIPGLLKQYGGEQEWYEREVPQHRVYLPDFYIARVPVTVTQFRAFFEATGYQTDAEREGWSWMWANEKMPGATWRHPFGLNSDVLRKNDHPVTQVSWHDAQAFCEWAKVRLPSEAEWEKAARGTDDLAFPWGNQAPTPDLCNFDMKVGDTAPVDKYAKGASPYGILDMAGNVFEWTNSLHKAYPYDPKDGREDPQTDDEIMRVVRGGSFWLSGRSMRCAYWDIYNPHSFNYFIGFRVVCVSPPS